VLHENAFMVKLCHRQHCKLYLTVHKINCIPTNLYSFHALHINTALKQSNVPSLMNFFRRLYNLAEHIAMTGKSLYSFLVFVRVAIKHFR
jgi:hypothetical protein